METKEIIKKNIKWIALFICVILVIAIIENVVDQEIAKLDVAGYNIISKHLISEQTIPIAKTITQFGGPIVLIATATILLIVIKNKKIGKLIWANLIIATLLNQALKRIVQRPRPTGLNMIDESGYSFPSGHSMVSAAFYGFLIYLIYKNIKNKYLKWALITVLSVLIILIGTSRIYLGVHYTSDVIAGYLFGFAYLIISISLLRKFNVIKGANY